MVAVNVTMLNTVMLLLGAKYSPKDKDNIKLQQNSQMTFESKDCAHQCHPHQDCPHQDCPHQDCPHKVTCDDPCVLDPPEVCIDPLQGLPFDDPSLNILVNLSWPRRDVFWFLDGFRRLEQETNFRRKRQVTELYENSQHYDSHYFSEDIEFIEFREFDDIDNESTTVPPTGKLPTIKTTPMNDDLTTNMNGDSTSPMNGDSTSPMNGDSTTPKNDDPVLTVEEIEEIIEFSKEFQLEVVKKVSEINTIEEQRVALEEGEAVLADKETLELTIREANITFDQQDDPTLKHQLAFRRTDPISTTMAKLGIISGSVTGNFIKVFAIPTIATVGMSFLGPITDCLLKHSDLLRPCCVECLDPNPYRTLDGSCNNQLNRLWGAAFTPYRRDLPADYFDGVSSFRRAVNSNALPSARLVSSIVNNIRSEKSPSFSILHMTFGQIVDHDLIATPMARASFSGYLKEASPIKCCPIQLHPECAAIPIPHDDPFYKGHGQTCMEFVRSAPVGKCFQGPRDQTNQHTSYLDGSVIYGVKSSETNGLRTFVNGLLTEQVTQHNQVLLPRATEAEDGCNTEEKMAQGEFCFKAGDGRVNEQILLTFLQTLWAREHNRVARNLKISNMNWDDEKLFQETRRIIGAELQQVTYNEFLPTIIGPTLMASSNLNPLRRRQQTTDYDPNVNADISNAFATAAYRYGHSMIADYLLYITKQGMVSPQELSTLFFNPFELYRRDAMCNLARGSIALAADKMDPYFTLEVAGKLFRGHEQFGLDLVALNIQRGRDHGLPPYNKWRKFCGLPKAQNFDDLLPQMNEKRIDALKKAYQNVNDIDLFVGGISEIPIPGALLGHTFTCIIHNQFIRIKRGDRYWFEYKNGPGAFTKAQIKQLHRVTFARIMCNNLPELEHIQRWPLRNLGPDNKKVCCTSIRQYNLNPWKDNYVDEEAEEEEDYDENQCF